MTTEERRSCQDAIERVEAYLSAVSEQEQSHPSFRIMLGAQRRLVSGMRTRYVTFQDRFIASCLTEQLRELEIIAKAGFLERCDTLLIRIDALLAETTHEFDDEEDTDRSQELGGDGAGPANISQTMLQFMRESERRHQQAERRHREQIDMLTLAITGNVSMNRSFAGQPNRSVKLPHLQLPTFDGKFSSWISFKDRFTASIIDHQDLSNVQKLEYLHSAVSGDALSAIKHLNTTSQNFSVAWQILKDKFERKKDIVSEQIKAFYAMPRLTGSNPHVIHDINNIFTETTMAVDAMEITQRDPWLITYCLDRLDADSRVQWGREHKTNDVPTAQEFKKFLDQRCIDHKNSCTSTAPPKDSKAPVHTRSNQPQKKQANALLAATSDTSCKCCQQGSHPLFKCPTFLAQTSEDRFNTVKRLSLCRNCFASHMTNSCTFHKCRTCQGKHSHLLHDYYASKDGTASASSPSLASVGTSHASSGPSYASGGSTSSISTQGNASGSGSTTNLASSSGGTSAHTLVCSSTESELVTQPPRVFLATASVHVLAANGETVPCRVVLDGGAQVNLMTSSLYHKLNLPKIPTGLAIAGVNESRCRSKFFVNTTIFSRTSDSCFNFKSFVLPKIAGNIPNWPVDTSVIQVPHDVEMADPAWYKQQPVDLLISGNTYWASWLNEKRSLGPGLPMLMETVFGHVIVGEHEPLQVRECLSLNLLALEETMRKFLLYEHLQADQCELSDEHQAAERHFVETHRRKPDGTFVVNLPFKSDPRVLGDSRPLAVRQFLALERRFLRSPTLQTMYVEYMKDQLAKGWAQKVTSACPTNQVYYMPHHGVLKESSVTTKLRVVYNASAKTTTGVSLNDILMVGPTIQPELTLTLVNFRKHPIAVTGDISKMYLRIELAPTDTDYQRFVFRETPSQPLQDYKITRVCFGVASSPFLAIRALMQLATECEKTHPLASRALRSAFYVDDCIMSVESLEEAKSTQSQLKEVLDGAGFPITKWKSNRDELEPPADENDSPDTVHITDSSTSALGISWNSRTDDFSFRPPISSDEICDTKRKVMSAIAKLFDPLGLIGPIIIEAKIILQHAHRLKIGWDDKLSEEFTSRWNKYISKLQNLPRITIPRCVVTITSPNKYQIHAFSDASGEAYGAAVYLVAMNNEGEICSNLLVAKSRVVPISAPIVAGSNELTMPKLELCGALLAAELVAWVKDQFQIESIHYWCDAKVVIYWIHGQPEHYKVYVANRIRKIQKLSDPSQWRHVAGVTNPADVISRGTSPLQLESSSLWWHGPEWLVLGEKDWPPALNSLEETTTDVSVLLEIVEPATINEDTILFKLLPKISSLNKIIRITAYCLRLVNKIHAISSLKSSDIQPICAVEMEHALKRLILIDQKENFPGLAEELTKPSEDQRIPPKYKYLKHLALFVDEEGLMRVGGRLENSNLPFEFKHPLLLPNSQLTDLIVHRKHLDTLHCGPLLLLVTLRQKFWPIGGRRLVRKICHRCVVCRRANPKPLKQLMANLPRDRVQFSRPFQATGVDYAGPILHRPSGLRTTRNRPLALKKGYIAVFVCLATKAAHLEFVTSLTTEGFLAAFRRFSARRNVPRIMYSDHGSNFEGAAAELRRLFDQCQFQNEIQEGTAEAGVQWQFIPSRAPHHGGLWESCVKQVKKHLYRVAGNLNFTYEEMTTILYQIEATLNSRPISLVSDDPHEQNFLTPGHFLTGAPGNYPPDPYLGHIPLNRLSIWQLCQRRAQDFSEKFHSLYLNVLQQRSKWTEDHSNLIPDEPVLLVDDTQMGNKWVLGKVLDVHPGRDGKIRVVTVMTPKGIYTRPITKVARLFAEEGECCSEELLDTSEHPGENVRD